MSKRLCAFMMALFLIVQSVSVVSFAVNETGSPKHIMRVVSIVFDDSGSMYKDTDRWAYTSYAMQAFTAMMGSDDILYVTYLNSSSNSKKVDLSKSGKQNMINGFAKTVFGGGTPNKISNGADCLTKEYKNYGANAKYYLVVMADGDLDPNEGEMANALRDVSTKTKENLSGADFETIYFSMKTRDDINIPGVTSHHATTSEEIVTALRNVSTDIMGRTKIDYSVSGGKLSFELKYPALSIAVFAQKKNHTFKNVKVPILKDGKSASYDVSTYYVECPTEVVKNPNFTQYQEIIPSSPPSGFVSLIANGNNSLPKGKYTIDLSAYNIQKQDLVVLVEPAVKIGCQYFLGDDPTPKDFSEIKKFVREGDFITIKCGLYEMNSNGSLGDAVPLNVLSPDYNIYINDKIVGKKLNGENNTYQITVSKDYEYKDLKIEAVLNGYQPFTLKETFDQLNTKPIIDSSNSGLPTEIKLTKPVWKDWVAGKYEISIPLVSADKSLLSNTSIKTEGFDGLPTGICSGLGKNIRIEGNNIIYKPILSSSIDFGKLPSDFKIILQDEIANSPLAEVKISVIQPKYKFEITNEFEGTPMGLEFLKNNEKAVTFTIFADYDDTGLFIPISQSECENSVKITLDSGVLPGKTAEAAGSISFIPQYNIDTNADISPADIVGKNHSIIASATVDGVSIQSESVILSISKGSYKVVVENPITEAFTLDTIKTNSQKIVFSLLADYNNIGFYDVIADWDVTAYDNLVINSGDLPGIFNTEYDAAGKPIGKSFIPLYDENNNNGVVFTKVAGKVHKITASFDQYGVSGETTVEVLAPKYDIVVQKDDITIVDVDLLKNEQGVEFAISRNERQLTKEELEGLAPFQLSFSKEQSWMTIDAEVKESESGEAYLFCRPAYDGWTFVSPNLWKWICLFKVSKGDMTLDLTVGQNTANASIHVNSDYISWIIFWIIIAIILLLLWCTFCCLTRIRFIKGSFYKVTFRNVDGGTDCVVSARTPINANKKGFLRFLRSGKILVPFSKQTVKITVGNKQAIFVAQKNRINRFNLRSFPYGKSENGKFFNKGSLANADIAGIINRDKDFSLDPSSIEGTECGQQDFKMSGGTFLVEHNTQKILFFVSKKEEKKIREKHKASLAKSKNLYSANKKSYKKNKK